MKLIAQNPCSLHANKKKNKRNQNFAEKSKEIKKIIKDTRQPAKISIYTYFHVQNYICKRPNFSEYRTNSSGGTRPQKSWYISHQLSPQQSNDWLRIEREFSQKLFIEAHNLDHVKRRRRLIRVSISHLVVSFPYHRLKPTNKNRRRWDLILGTRVRVWVRVPLFLHGYFFYNSSEEKERGRENARCEAKGVI